MMSEQKKVYVVFKTHYDVGFTHMAKDIIQWYGQKMIPDVIRTCKETQKLPKQYHYVWTMPSWPLLQTLKQENAELDVIEQTEELIRNGQITWHALPFTTQTEFCGLEEFIRGIYLSRQLSEKFGRWPVTAKMSDVPGHTWILPSQLSKAGVKFLHLGCNPACIPPDVPMLFYWEGPDGNRVLTFYNKGYYGTSLLPPKDWPYPVWLALTQTNDNIGPQQAEAVEGILNEIERGVPGAQVAVGTLDDFYFALEPYLTEDIPVVRGDLADTWIHGVGTYPREVSMLRSLRHEITDTEKALNIGSLLGLFDSTQVKEFGNNIDKAFEYSIVFGEHTYGLNTLDYMGHNRYYFKKDFSKNENIKLMEESWEEQKEWVHKIQQEIGQVHPTVVERIAQSIDAEEPRVVIFNGLSWKRSAWVHINALKDIIAGKQLIDDDSGKAVMIDEQNGAMHVFVEDVPPLGYKVLLVRNTSDSVDMKNQENSSLLQKNQSVWSPSEGIIENAWFRIEADSSTGTIKSLYQKDINHEWVGLQGKYGFGQYVYEIYGIEDVTEYTRNYTYRFHDWQVNVIARKHYPEIEHRTFSPEGFTLSTYVGAESVSLVMEAQITGESVVEFGNAKTLITKITLYTSQRHIDMEFEIKSKEETFLTEGGHFVFPLNLENANCSMNKLGCVVDPSKDIVRNANHTQYCCENWVDMDDGEKGFAVIPFDTPLFSLGSPKLYQFRNEYLKEEPVICFNAFNNAWGTNYPQWIGGDYRFKYRLIPHQSNWQKGNVAKQALECVTPPLVGYSADKPLGEVRLPVKFSLLEDNDGMEILSFKTAEAGDGFILRVREIEGKAREIRLVFACEDICISKCDLLEEKREAMTVKNGLLDIYTKPFEIHTLHIAYK